MEWRPRSGRESRSHRSAARGRGIDRTPTEVTIGCGLAKSTQSLGTHRAVAGHDRTDISWIFRADVSENAFDFGAWISQGGRPGGQRPGHDDPHLISIGWHDPVSGPREASEVGTRKILLADRRPTSTIDRCHANLTIEVDSSFRPSARLGGIDVASHPTARGPRRNRVTSSRLRGTAATRMRRPVGRVIAGIVATTVPAPAPPPVVVIAVRTPSDVTGPPSPAHPRRAPISPPRPGPTEANRKVPRPVVVGQPTPGLVRDPGPTGRRPIPPAGPIRLPASTDGRLPCPGVDVIDVDPAAVVVELGCLTRVAKINML